MILPWYFLTDLLLCALGVWMVIWAWPSLGRRWRISLCLTAVLVMLMQIVNEVLSLLVFKAWIFGSDYNHLIGWSIAGIPIEEYLFWFAFAWIVPFAYGGLAARFGDRDRARGIVPEVDPHG